MLQHYILVSLTVSEALREVLDIREQKRIPTTELVQIAEFVLKNNFLEFNSQIIQQISGIAIGTKRAKFMDKMGLGENF